MRNRLAASPVRTGMLRLLQRLSSGHDVDDDVGLGVGVVLNVSPAARREVPLGSFVQGTVGLVDAEVLAEADHPVDLRAARAEYVQVDVGVGSVEQPMLEPLWLASAKHVAGGLEPGNVDGV